MSDTGIEIAEGEDYTPVAALGLSPALCFAMRIVLSSTTV
jgi:hypothetical protein